MLTSLKNIVFLCLINIFSLRIEQLIKEKQLEHMLSGQRIGFYLGSFDPPHLGHDALASEILKLKLCDLILIYPVWGSDKFKERSDIGLRLEMLDAMFGDHPNILVTKLSPSNLQDILMEKSGELGKVRGKFGTKYTGIMGSDVALISSKTDEKTVEWMSKTYMRGCKLAAGDESSIASISFVPAEEFIIGRRKGDMVSHLNYIGDRSCVALTNAYPEVSSTDVKKNLKNGEPMNVLIDDKIAKMIFDRQLYQISPTNMLNSML